MVSRHAAAMAQINSWPYKRLQNKEAEKRIFFSLSAPLFFSHLCISLSPSTTSIGSTSYTRCSERTAFFSLLELCLKKCKFNSWIHARSCFEGMNFHFTLNFSVRAQTPPDLEPMSSSCAELIKSSIRSEPRFSFHGCRVWIQSRCSDVLTIWCSVPFVHTVLVAGNAWNATEV